MAKNKEAAIIDKWLDNVARPIILADPGWELPKWVRIKIYEQRVWGAKDNPGTAVEAEALAYISNASLLAPLSHDWADIYSYLFTKIDKEKLPLELRQESISKYQEQLLTQLRTWLYKQGIKYLKEARRNERKSEQEGVSGGLEACSAGVR